MGMTYTVSVSKIDIEFHRAHSALVNALGGAHTVLALAEFAGVSHWKVLQSEWVTAYHISPSEDWKTLEFSSEKQYTFFMLRWS